MSDRFRRVTIYSDDVVWAEKAILDTQENRVAPFGREDKNDDLSDVIEIMENGDTEWAWNDANKVRIEG